MYATSEQVGTRSFYFSPHERTLLYQILKTKWDLPSFRFKRSAYYIYGMYRNIRNIHTVPLCREEKHSVSIQCKFCREVRHYGTIRCPCFVPKFRQGSCGFSLFWNAANCVIWTTLHFCEILLEFSKAWGYYIPNSKMNLIRKPDDKFVNWDMQLFLTSKGKLCKLQAVN